MKAIISHFVVYPTLAIQKYKNKKSRKFGFYTSKFCIFVVVVVGTLNIIVSPDTGALQALEFRHLQTYSMKFIYFGYKRDRASKLYNTDLMSECNSGRFIGEHC